jgi:hypothetical protein
MPNDVRGQSEMEKQAEPGRKEPAAAKESPSPARVDYRCANLRGSDMGGISLEHADFRAADLQGVNFSGCNLRYSDFRGANVSGANFQNASLYGAKMQGAEAFNADFRNSDLRLANFRGAYLDKAMMPLPSPGEIDGGAGQQAKSWREELAQRRNSGQDDNAGNDQNGQAHGRSLPGEERDKGRGRGR